MAGFFQIAILGGFGQAGVPHQREASRNWGRPPSAQSLVAVCGRAHPDQLREAGAERAEAGEAYEVADLGYGEIDRTQELAGTLHAPAAEIAGWCLPVGVAERPDEV